MRETILLLMAAALAASASHAVVPGQINYQGLLLDSAGDPVTGNQDFVFALYDAPSGGTSLWSESHDDVPVLDGVYDVVLGSTTPITLALVSGGALHLEITVGGETLAPRQQLLAVPYAIEAESAGAVGALPSLYLEQLLEFVPFDGQDPPNQDASEGTADTDGDTLPNFIDPDNDDDGIEDADELAAGSDINLVTPSIAAFTPQAAAASETTNVTISGQGFESGLSVSFGSESPTPMNVTSTSFDVDVGPQSAGTRSVVVTNANAETGSASFDFVDPVVTSVSPNVVDSTVTTLVTVTGSGFVPGLQVSVGSETPTPMNLTLTGFQVEVGPQAAGRTLFEASYPSGSPSSVAFELVDASAPKIAFATSAPSPGAGGAIGGADAICAAHATAGSLPGTFLAWLGTAGTDPDSRFSGGAPYETTTGANVASSYADLTDGTLGAPIRQDELGNTLIVLSTTWTAVLPDGTFYGSTNCSGWTNGTTGAGRVGVTSNTDTTWTDNSSVVCTAPRHLYCFEQ